MELLQHYHDYPLAPVTSFKAGGNAEQAVLLPDTDHFESAIRQYGDPDWILGYGSNSLISDRGLPGTTFLIKGGTINQDKELIIADAGVWWDDLVQYAISKKLWGLECTSQVPGSVGAAIVGNIAAYGQAVADTLQWVEIYDKAARETRRWQADELGLVYRASQTLQRSRNLIVLRAAFLLNDANLKPLEYDSALVHARKNNFDTATLQGTRQAVIAARQAAGSLWDYRDDHASRTAGSFFRNPLVDAKKAEAIMNYDETGTSLELLKKMNQVHGGTAARVSAAHVLLAAGFKRGQSWGAIRLHPQHVLKIENFGGANAQQIYDVARHIILTVREELDIELEPEVRFLGDFL